MSLVLSVLAWRGTLAFAGLGVLWGLELWRPFKPWTDRRLPRYARNLFLAAINALALEVALGGAIVAYTSWLQSRGIGLLPWLGAGLALNTLASIVVLDFATYLWHWAYHEVPVMWRLHRPHHSDRDLDVTSATRFHLAEILLSTIYRMGVVALLGPSVAGVAAFEASLLAFAQMQHSNLRLPGDWDRRLRRVFVTPDMHRVHHSEVKGHTNSNYSTVFSWWDRLFKTYNVEGIDQEGIRIGLPEYSKPEDVTLLKVLAMPFGPACGSTAAASVVSR